MGRRLVGSHVVALSGYSGPSRGRSQGRGRGGASWQRSRCSATLGGIRWSTIGSSRFGGGLLECGAARSAKS
eukprot:1582383-Alexandrium_andersonii.AAC.1